MAGFPKAGDEYGGRYRIVRQLGHGGMGIVYEAVDTVLNRSVALKIVLPSLPDRDDFQARFAREAAVLAKIKSRNIVGIYDYGEHEDTVFFATELFPDGDLQTWLAKNGPLDRRASLALVAQVCEALADAHAMGVIHRDVKPGNVLLWSRSEGLIPYLCDFGIAIEGTEDGRPRASLTRTGTLIGSPAYMAPERHFGHAADERGDLYSVGCLLWATLTGDAPYSGTDFQMMNSHINSPVPRLGSGHTVDERIDDVLAHALNKDPEQRSASAGALRTELLAIIRDIDAAVVPMPLPPAARHLADQAVGGQDASGHVSSGQGFHGQGPDAPASDGVREDDRTRATTGPSGVPAVASGRPAAGPDSADDAAPPAHHSTVIRGLPTTPPPPPPSSTSGDERTGRRWVPVALVAALVAVALGTTAFVVNAVQGGDEPIAQASETTSAATPSTSPTTDPLASPDAPAIVARPGYRSVVFQLTPPPTVDGVRQRVEVKADDGWRTARRMVLPTEQGGDRGCIQARTVARDAAGQEQPGEPVRSCGRAQPRTAELVRTPGSCSGVFSGYTYPCQWYGVRLSGFASGSSPLARLRPESSSTWCADFDCRTVRVGPDGRGATLRYFRIFQDSGIYVLDADGVTRQARLYY